jgi:hypothetical protein
MALTADAVHEDLVAVRGDLFENRWLSRVDKRVLVIFNQLLMATKRVAPNDVVQAIEAVGGVDASRGTPQRRLSSTLHARQRASPTRAAWRSSSRSGSRATKTRLERPPTTLSRSCSIARARSDVCGPASPCSASPSTSHISGRGRTSGGVDQALPGESSHGRPAGSVLDEERQRAGPRPAGQWHPSRHRGADEQGHKSTVENAKRQYKQHPDPTETIFARRGRESGLLTR